jgi:hypothetical protein
MMGVIKKRTIVLVLCHGLTDIRGGGGDGLGPPHTSGEEQT